MSSPEAHLDNLWSRLTPAARDAVVEATTASHELELRPDSPVDDAGLLMRLMSDVTADSAIGIAVLETTFLHNVHDEASGQRGLTALPLVSLLEGALEEAESLGSTVIGREHLLLALMATSWLAAAQILSDNFVYYERVKRRMRRMVVSGRWQEGQDDY